ncbi:hypothetical protein SAMD00019534_054790 [Acytostelium subglobosum LB1]|uniref:hypothetical protein n=1 Tax=Acytostelium subglobosum LB1 TaxID=1410327 RepID=UPI000644F776|nr:hypothetical protein SAMD00019534_054790 [Acytostelium subglobosum LB1]GAM22304.1 hypothetical protein SAMD00019534_054790 [Acytostelium subglobosum LB1]|eukprot:XP_012754424.1 hypothetical protein SAMD00019534_054790 [Acytostelium subglobosum LB1]
MLMQINYVKNISQPFETRMDNDRSENRTLKLHLTDGVHSFFAMEYQYIPFITPQLAPGTKVLVRDVPIRRGILLLDETNIRILGGSVQRLVDAATTAAKSSTTNGVVQSNNISSSTSTTVNNNNNVTNNTPVLKLNINNIAQPTSAPVKTTLLSNLIRQKKQEDGDKINGTSTSHTNGNSNGNGNGNGHGNGHGNGRTKPVDNFFDQDDIYYDPIDIPMMDEDEYNDNVDIANFHFDPQEFEDEDVYRSTPIKLPPTIPKLTLGNNNNKLSTSSRTPTSISPPLIPMDIVKTEKPQQQQQPQPQFIAIALGASTRKSNDDSGNSDVIVRISDGTGGLSVRLARDLMIKLMEMSEAEFKKMVVDKKAEMGKQLNQRLFQTEGIFALSIQRRNGETFVLLDDIADLDDASYINYIEDKSTK